MSGQRTPSLPHIKGRHSWQIRFGTSGTIWPLTVIPLNHGRRSEGPRTEARNPVPSFLAEMRAPALNRNFSTF